MTLFYLTTKSYPATTADHVYIRELARAFASTLDSDFTLLVNKNTGNDLDMLSHQVIGGGTRFRLLSMALLFLKPQGAHLRDAEFFFSNDFNITLMLLFLKKIRVIKGKIAFDAHLMTRTWKDSYLFNHVDFIFSTSDVLKEHINKILGEKSAQVHTVLGGVDLMLYSKVQDEHLQEVRMNYPLLGRNKTVIGYIGGFTSLGYEKGLMTMIASLTILPERFICLFVGGQTHEIEKYKKFAQSKNVEDRCLFIEKVDFQEVPIFQMMCDILAIPYPDEPHFSDFGFPMKVFEYLASGRSIVYSKLKIMDDVLSGVGTSFVPGDYSSFAEAVMSAESTQNTNILRELEKFTWKHKALEILTILQK